MYEGLNTLLTKVFQRYPHGNDRPRVNSICQFQCEIQIKKKKMDGTFHTSREYSFKH